jgi:GAF domain-containing protein
VLADEQAALRRVATLVARGVRPEEVFAAVTEEAGRVLAVEYASLGRYEPDGAFTLVASSLVSPAGGALGGITSARLSRRPAVRLGSTATPMPPGHSVSQPARTGPAQPSGRRSSSRAASGG